MIIHKFHVFDNDRPRLGLGAMAFVQSSLMSCPVEPMPVSFSSAGACRKPPGVVSSPVRSLDARLAISCPGSCVPVLSPVIYDTCLLLVHAHRNVNNYQGGWGMDDRIAGTIQEKGGHHTCISLELHRNTNPQRRHLCRGFVARSELLQEHDKGPCRGSHSGGIQN